jgi:hypothetical protein
MSFQDPKGTGIAVSRRASDWRNWLGRLLQDRQESGSGTITERVRSAFPDEASLGYAGEFAESLRGNMKDIAEAARRSVLFGLLTVATFELINRAAVTDVQIGPLKVRNLSLINKAIPLVFAYLVYDTAALELRYRYCERTYLEIMKLAHKRIRSVGLDCLTFPATPSLFGPFLLETQSRLGRLAGTLRQVFRAAAIVSTLGVEFYLLSQLFKTYGFRDILTWFVVAMSLVLLGCAAIVYVVIMRVKGELD